MDNLSPEELYEYEKSLNEEEKEESLEEDKEELEKEMEETESEEESKEDSTEEETQESEESEESSKEDKRFEGKTKEDVEKSYHELEKLYQKQANELGNSRKSQQKIDDLEKRIEELSKSKEEVPVREQFDPDKYSQLLIDDPAEAARYYHELYIVPKEEERAANIQAQKDAEQAEKVQQENIHKTLKSFEEFFELDEFKEIGQEEGNKFGSFIRETIQPPKSGYFTVDDLKKAYSWFNPEKAIVTAKKEVLKKVEDAAPEVKTISAASGAKVKSTSMPKGLNAQEMAEWAEQNMTTEEMEKMLDEAE